MEVVLIIFLWFAGVVLIAVSMAKISEYYDSKKMDNIFSGTKTFLRKVEDKPVTDLENMVVNGEVKKVQQIKDGVYQVIE